MSSRRSRALALAEALGYGGGALVLIGVVLVVTGAWNDLGTATRIALTGGWAIPLILGGWIARPRDWTGPGAGPRERLTDVMWATASTTAALGAGVAAHEPFGAESVEVIALAGASATVVVGSALWALRSLLVTQFLVIAAALTVAGSAGAVAGSEGTGGAAVLLGASAAIIAGTARRTDPVWVPVLAGAGALPIGISMVTTQWEGEGLIVAAVMAIVLVTVVETPDLIRDRVTRGVLVVTTIWFLAFMVPPAIGHYSDEAGVLTGAVVGVAGIYAVVIAWKSPLVRPFPVTVIGSLMAMLAPAIMASQSLIIGIPIGLIMATVCIGIAARTVSTPPALLGGLGLAIYVPWAVTELIEGDLAAPIAVISTGVVLMVVAVGLVLRRSQVRPADSSASTPSFREPEGVGSRDRRSARRWPDRPRGRPSVPFAPRPPARRRGV